MSYQNQQNTRPNRKQEQHARQIAAARVTLSILEFATQDAFHGHLATLPAREAHYLWLASLEPAELSAIEREGVAVMDDPAAGSFAVEFDASRDDKSAEEVALNRRLEISGQLDALATPSESGQMFDMGEALIRVMLIILDSPNMEASTWGLALHCGAAERLGINTQIEAAARLGISKQTLNAHVQRFESIFGPISKRFHTTPVCDEKKLTGEKHWRKTRTIADALR